MSVAVVNLRKNCGNFGCMEGGDAGWALIIEVLRGAGLKLSEACQIPHLFGRISRLFAEIFRGTCLGYLGPITRAPKNIRKACRTPDQV